MPPSTCNRTSEGNNRTKLVKDILHMNNIPLTAFEGGIGLPYAQVNHSCVANAGYPWIANRGKVFIYAHRAIKKEEQDTVTYVDQIV